MKDYDIGTLAFSKAGRDKNKLFVIINEESEYVYLVDGKNRTLNNPKRKNKKHIQGIHFIEETLLSKIHTQNKIIDEDIKRAIKIYKSKHEV